MGSCLAELGKTLWDELIKRAIAELRYPCCYTCIVEDFEKEKKWLEEERKTMGQHVEIAKNRGENIQRKVTFWEEQADKLIKEDNKTKKACCFKLCPDCTWRYRRGKELVEKTKDVRRLVNEVKNLGNVGLHSRVPDVERHSSKDYIPFESRKSQHKKLLDALANDNIYITGLQGMGGTGKTTLAKEVGNELKQLGQFARVILTTVSYTPNIEKIQDEIAGPLGLEFKDCTDSDRLGKLWNRLTNGEKILLILDDVWRPIKFEVIGIPSSHHCKGCKVLLTTRKSQVCKQMGCGGIIQLELLPNKEAWILFKNHSGITDDSHESLLKKGHEIVDACGGLPVAIAIIASSLKGSQGLEEWEVALNSLRKPMPKDEKDADENLMLIYNSLKHSYDYMTDEKAKRLFLLCSVYQEDESISTEILTRYVVGAGLFEESHDEYNDARSEVVVAKNKLIDSCLLLKDEEGIVKMHDLIRDAAQWISNEWIQVVNLVDNRSQKSLVEKRENIKYLSCQGKGVDVFSVGLGGSKLEILIVCIDEDDSLEIPNSFFQNMIGLQVFHLLGKSWSSRPSLFLPQSIQSLTKIRSLLLERFELHDISILGNLPSLETLDLVQCLINELPREIAKLKKLKLLKLSSCTFVSLSINSTFKLIERCSSLEELYFLNNHGFLFESTTNHQIRALLEWQRYHIVDDWYDIDALISKCVSCRKIDAFVSEATFKHLVQTAGILKLKQIQGGWRNLMPDIIPMDKGMNDLVKLDLTSWLQLQCLIVTNSSKQKVFTKLVVLVLRNMKNLKEICSGPFPPDFLSSLERLIIENCNLQNMLFKSKLNLCNVKIMCLYDCPELVSLFQLSTSRSLELLEELKIRNCEKLENIITYDDGEEVADNDNKSRGSIFPNLRTLEIISCPLLEIILPFHSARVVPKLDTISICHCDELKYIFGQCQHKHENRDMHVEVKDEVLPDSLEEMKLRDLLNFIDIFPECDHPTCSSMKRSSSKDGSKEQLQSELIKCNIFPWKYKHKLRSTINTEISLDQPHDSSIVSAPNSHCPHLWKPAQCLFKQSNIIGNITHITLYNISKIKSVFTLPVASTMLLETLSIRKCEELQHIIISNDDWVGNNMKDVFPKLETLIVEDCEQLEYIFGLYSYGHQNHSEIHLSLPVLEYLKLINLSNFIGMCPENHHTTLPALTNFEFHGYAKRPIKSIGHIVKELSGNVEYFFTLENLQVHDSQAEHIFCLDEMIGQQINLGMQKIQLGNMPQMTYVFKGPKNSFVLQNTVKIKIVQCEKLEVIFSTSIGRCLPQLRVLMIQKCEELKQIIEEEVEVHKTSKCLSPRTCFPELQILVVENCDKLNYVFPTSIRRELPKLKALVIKEAYKLTEVFGGEGDQKVEIPNLIFVAFVELPTFCQGIQFQTTVHRWVFNCPQLSLTSTSIEEAGDAIYSFGKEFEEDWYFNKLLHQWAYKMNTQVTNNESSITKTTEDDPDLTEVEGASGHELTSSHFNTNQSIQAKLDQYNQNQNCIETNELIFQETRTKQTPKAKQEFVENVSSSEKPKITNFPPTNSEVISKSRPSPLDIPRYKTHSHQTGNQNIQEDSQSDKVVTTTVSIDSETWNVLVPLQTGVKRNVEEGTTSANANTPKSSTHSKSEDDDSQIIVPSSSAINMEPLVTKDVDEGESQETTNTHALENSSQTMEDFASLTANELGQLVSKKYLATENLSMLTDFLVKYPSVRLTNNSFSNRYKGYAYNCLAELLKFLQTHSVLDVLGSSHTDFVELLQDVRRFSFDKNWLDGVERRALFPILQVSQEASKKLLDSKRNLSQHMEDLKHQLASSEEIMQSIIQQEVLEAKAALNATLGY